jgi:formylglycine-generating enzyme required for sulfatase activity/predicted Ser/Thr protein kinase
MDSPENLTQIPLSRQIARDYEIIRLLGKGGMGEVYLAEQLRVGRRRVALKVLNRACSEDPEVIKRFENEAAFAGRIHHLNVVMVYESRITDDGQLYVAMEYVEGSNLRDVINQRGPLPLAEVVEITRQICSGLSVAHKLGIVHRDIKPDNIMLANAEDGELVVKLLDFGIARLSEAGAGGSQTQTGIVMGTPYYMSPEQALGHTGDKIDLRSDIYSLGMVVYQMMTAKLPFESASWMQIMYKHINERPMPPSQFRPELANYNELEKVVLKALEKPREDRQQTATQFASQLDAAYNKTVLGDADRTLVADYGRPAAGGEFGYGSSAPTIAGGPASNAAAASGLSAPIQEAYSAAMESAPTLPGLPVVARPDQTGTGPSLPSVGAAGPGAGRFWDRRNSVIVAVVGVLVICGIAAYLIAGPGANGLKRSRRGALPSHSFSFTVSTLNANGDVAEAHRADARYFSEELGEGANMEMIEVPAGTFLMGVPDEQKAQHPDEVPQHQVTVKSFHMGRYEVTNAEWAAVAKLPKVKRDLNPEPSQFKADPKLPVQNVSWLDAEEFCARLSAATGRNYRLPTEAEWEYACRAGTETPFYFGATITANVVNYDAHQPYGSAPKGMTRKQPVPVGNLGSPNAFGLSDMHGNMAEWCLDGWHENYNRAPTEGSPWVEGADNSLRVTRGGSWDDRGDDCRSAARDKYGPETGIASVGFRVVVKLPQSSTASK